MDAAGAAASVRSNAARALDASGANARALARTLRHPTPALARDIAIHAALGLFFVLFTTDLDRDLVRRGVLPLPGAAAYLAGALAILAVALRVRSAGSLARAIRAVRGQAAAVAREHLVFFAAFAALAAMSLPYWFRRDDPTPGALIFLVVAFGACAVAALLPLSERVRSGWRGYLAAAFLVYCAGIWIDVLRPGTFSVVDERAAGFATDTNTAAYAVSLLAAALLRYGRRPALADYGVLYVSGLTIFLTLSRGGALVWLALAAAYAAFVLARASAGERRAIGVRFAAAGALTGASIWGSMQTFDYFSQPATQERVHIFFGNQSWFRLRMKPTHRTVPLIAERYGGFADAIESDAPIESAPAPGLLAGLASGDGDADAAPPGGDASGSAPPPTPDAPAADAEAPLAPAPDAAPAASAPDPAPEPTPPSASAEVTPGPAPPRGVVAAVPGGMSPTSPVAPDIAITVVTVTPDAAPEPATGAAATPEPATGAAAAPEPPPSAEATSADAAAVAAAPPAGGDASEASGGEAAGEAEAAGGEAEGEAEASGGGASGEAEATGGDAAGGEAEAEAEPASIDSRFVRQSGEYLYVDTVRVVRLKIAVEAIRDSPLVGYGNRYGSSEGLGAHNMYLAAWVDFGIPGFFAYAALVLGGLWSCWRLRFWPALFVMGVLASWGMFSHTVLEQRSLFVAVGLLLALALARPGGGAESGAAAPPREALP